MQEPLDTTQSQTSGLKGVCYSKRLCLRLHHLRKLYIRDLWVDIVWYRHADCGSIYVCCCWLLPYVTVGDWKTQETTKGKFASQMTLWMSSILLPVNGITKAQHRADSRSVWCCRCLMAQMGNPSTPGAGYCSHHFCSVTAVTVVTPQSLVSLP